MHATSPVPGTAPVLQSAGVFQLYVPVAVTFHWSVHVGGPDAPAGRAGTAASAATVRAPPNNIVASTVRLVVRRKFVMLTVPLSSMRPFSFQQCSAFVSFRE